MNSESKEQSVQSFNFEGKEQPISFIETMQVANGVSCKVYSFVDDKSKDLGIIRIKPNKRTPLQRVLKGDRTVEGYISGRGKLTITKTNGEKEVYIANGLSEEPIVVSVHIGETMQWEADKDSDLLAYEICFPPYEDGRYEDIA